MKDIEEHIRRAAEEGKFDNLPGKGKPLRLEGDPLADPEWRLAYHVLREGGYTLPWIELQQEIDAESEAARAGLRRAWAWRQKALAGGEPPGLVEAEWQRARRRFAARVEKLNRRIFDYNLQVPAERLQRRKLDVEREAAQVCAQEPPTSPDAGTR
ncbi:MAG: DnaJ family domain-containing protein [Chloroflexota bacterium]